MLEAGLTALLGANTDLTNLISTRIYPVQVPEGTLYPCLSYQVVSAPSDYTLEGLSTQEKRIQFDAWGTNYADVKAVIAATDAVLDGFQGTLPDGTVVLGSFRGEEIDLTDQYSRTFRTLVEYHVHYR